MLEPERNLFEKYLNSFNLINTRLSFSGYQKLFESMEYSLKSGGKRFRPLLVLAIMKDFGGDLKSALPFCLALEMVHTYSLIHDDLPCMDNDDFRRGQPTNHKVFGEAVALLAGDGLLTAAFDCLATEYANDSGQALALIRILAKAAGPCGMIGGQAIDIDSLTSKTPEEYQCQHELKTGALITAAFEGAALLLNLSRETADKIINVGKNLGFAFQLSDDLEEVDDGRADKPSFIHYLGTEGTKTLLIQKTQEALHILGQLNKQNGLIAELVLFNRNR